LLKLPTGTPHGQLPVLKLGDEVLSDSTRILERIDRELAPGVFSARLDERARAEAWLWEELADTALYPLPLTARWADGANWPRFRPLMFGAVPAPLRAALASYVRRGIKQSLLARDFTRTGLEDCYARMERTLDQLEARAPERGFWVADSLSVADLGLFGQLHSLRAPFTPNTAQRVAARKRLSAYLDRVDAATVR
jgi:glutathione S-transferase